MVELVDPSEIEDLVGSKRGVVVHVGRADSEEKMFYILHSQECLEKEPDLLLCPYSLALNRGIDEELWRGFEDRPIDLLIHDGRLEPHPGEKRTDHGVMS